MQWNRELLLYISGEGKKCVSSPSLGLLAASAAAAHNKKLKDNFCYVFSRSLFRDVVCVSSNVETFSSSLFLRRRRFAKKEGKNMDTGWKKSSHRQTTIKFPHFLWQLLNKKNWIAYKCFAWKLTAQLFPRSSSWWLILCASGERGEKNLEKDRAKEGKKTCTESF